MSTHFLLKKEATLSNEDAMSMFKSQQIFVYVVFVIQNILLPFEIFLCNFIEYMKRSRITLKRAN